MAPYLCYFAQRHNNFRLAELKSLARVQNIDIKMVESEYSDDSPFLMIDVPSDECVKRLCERAILIKEIYQVLEDSPNYDEILKKIQDNPPKCIPPAPALFTFRIKVDGYLKRLPLPYQMEIIDRLKILPLQHGIVDLSSEEVDLSLSILEDHGSPKFHVYFLRLVATGNRKVIDKFALNKRPYIGTTSMDPEISLLMSNQGLVKKGSLVLDPFVGTGSILLTCVHHGAYAIGADIDQKVIRGWGKPVCGNEKNANVLTNFKRFGYGAYADALIADNATSTWKNVEIFDAIITDPPYGVREGARQLGTKKTENRTRN